jgi:hypothetical protein
MALVTAHTSPAFFSLDPLIAEAKRRMRQRRLLLAAVAVLIAGGAFGGAYALRSSNGSSRAGARVTSREISNPLPDGAADCGRGVSGRGFRAWACMSGGARAGQPHPKELLVVRSDGSTVAYPAYWIGRPAADDGEVVAAYNGNLVRVTSSRLVPLLTYDELSRVLHARGIWPVGALRVDAHGGIYFRASFGSRSGKGCENRILERTSRGTVRQIRTLRTSICS